MIPVTDVISISEDEIHLEFVRSSGPGGQKVNKVATAVQLRFNVATSASLAEDVRRRLMRQAGRRVTEDGELIIDARRYRTQKRNRDDAIQRLVAMIRKAAQRPRIRRKTAPTAASRRKRLASKRRRSDTKRLRRPPADTD